MPDSVHLLVADLSSKDVAKQAAAAEALARLGKGARSAIIDLVNALRTIDPDAREWCLATLEDVGPPSSDQIGDLVKLTGGESPDAAYWAITLLGRAGGSATAAVPPLVEILENDTASLTNRERAAWAVGQIGPTATSAISALRKAAASGEARLSRLANAALESIGEPS